MFNNILNKIKQSNKTTKILLVIAPLFIILSVVIVIFFKPNNIDVDYGDDGSADYFLYHARFHNINELEDAIDNNSKVFDQIARDVLVFGRETIKEYDKNPPKVVGFVINKDRLLKKENIISFEGRYGSSKDKIIVEFELLNNDRIKNKITNIKSGYSMSDKLPSNSEDNKFIATLPYLTSEYNIYYSRNDTNTFRIDILSYNQNSKNNAINYLKSKVEEVDVNDENVLIYYVTTSFDQERTEYIQTYVSDPSIL